MMSEVFSIPFFEMGKSIPKIIHQTYSSNHLSAEIRANIEGMKQANPLWEYKFYDSAAIKNFIHEHYGIAMWQQYQRINPVYGAARADLFRYLLLYKCGGVYLDIKSGLSKPLDEILHDDDQFVLSSWRNLPGTRHEQHGRWPELNHIEGGEFQQWHIIAVAGHPFLRAVIEKVLHNINAYRPWRDGVGREGVLRVTGPIAYTLAIEPLLTQFAHRFVRFHDDLGLRYSIYQNEEQHILRSKSHYTLRADPVVSMKGGLFCLSELYLYLRGVRFSAFLRKLKHRLRAYKHSLKSMLKAI